MLQHIVFWFSVASLLASSHELTAEPPDTNYDESKVPAYELPKLLVDAAGRRVENREQWLGHRRVEIVRLFEDSVYGRTPTQKLPVRYEVTETDKQALGGLATRKQISASLATISCVPTYCSTFPMSSLTSPFPHSLV